MCTMIAVNVYFPNTTKTYHAVPFAYRYEDYNLQTYLYLCVPQSTTKNLRCTRAELFMTCVSAAVLSKRKSWLDESDYRSVK